MISLTEELAALKELIERLKAEATGEAVRLVEVAEKLMVSWLGRDCHLELLAAPEPAPAADLLQALLKLERLTLAELPRPARRNRWPLADEPWRTAPKQGDRGQSQGKQRQRSVKKKRQLYNRR